MKTLIATLLLVLLSYGTAKADYGIEPWLQHPLEPAQHCHPVTVRVNTWHQVTYQGWDGRLYQHRTLIGVRYEREWRCTENPPRYHVQ